MSDRTAIWDATPAYSDKLQTLLRPSRRSSQGSVLRERVQAEVRREFTTNVLAITDLHKSFGGTRAVDGVSFAVERGQLVGLLGPNGAGKTTTVSMIAGVVTPDQGAVRIDGAAVSGDSRTGRPWKSTGACATAL